MERFDRCSRRRCNRRLTVLLRPLLQALLSAVLSTLLRTASGRVSSGAGLHAVRVRLRPDVLRVPLVNQPLTSSREFAGFVPANFFVSFICIEGSAGADAQHRNTGRFESSLAYRSAGAAARGA